MGKLSTYNIEFKGLSKGSHEFEYQIDKSFFKHFENSLIDEGNINVKVVLEVHSSFLELHFKVAGTVLLTCDRCLEPYDQEIEGKADIYVKYGETENDEDDEVIWVHPEEHVINVAQLIYEYIAVNVPLRHVHPLLSDGREGCNPEMLKKLNEYSIKESEEIDERWSELKKLLNNN